MGRIALLQYCIDSRLRGSGGNNQRRFEDDQEGRDTKWLLGMCMDLNEEDVLFRVYFLGALIHQLDWIQDVRFYSK